jgi:hypothetical protein
LTSRFSYDSSSTAWKGAQGTELTLVHHVLPVPSQYTEINEIMRHVRRNKGEISIPVLHFNPDILCMPKDLNPEYSEHEARASQSSSQPVILFAFSD